MRCPGIYFEKNIKEKTILCTIIPNIGSWMTIKLTMRFKKNYFTEKIINLKYYIFFKSKDVFKKLIDNGEVYTKIDKLQKKIPIFLLLQAMGLTRKKIIASLDTTKNKKVLQENNKLINYTVEEALSDLKEILMDQEYEIVRRIKTIKFCD